MTARVLKQCKTLGITIKQIPNKFWCRTENTMPKHILLPIRSQDGEM
jgi:hypothetical protein